jgi:hypothetical protein
MLKVILTTNASESSITVSDVDTIICCGMHKSMEYSSKLHRSQLRNTWISKASATQRAGRTGRVRPGTVYRLYPSSLYQKFVEHETSEIHRTPLQEVILDLDLMFETTPSFQGVVPILSELLEPPEMQNITQSFQHLYELGMISTPTDFHHLTSLGRFAGSLPCDLQLGRLVALGVQLNMPRQACILAAAIMQPKSLFRIATPLVHTEPAEYSEIIRKTFYGMKIFDNDVYSEPIMHIKLFEAYIRVPEMKRSSWLISHGIVEIRMKQLINTVKDMFRRVHESLPKSKASIQQESSSKAWYELQNIVPMEFSSWKEYHDPNVLYPWNPQEIFQLRLLLCWTCNGQFLRMKPHSLPSLEDESSSHVIIESAKLEPCQLEEIFGCPPDSPADPPAVPWTLHSQEKRVYDAAFSVARLQTSIESTFRTVIRIMKHSSPRQPVQLAYIWDNYQLGDGISMKSMDYDVLYLIQYQAPDLALDDIFHLSPSDWVEYEADYYLAQIINPSKKQMKSLKQFQELLSSPSCSLLIPTPAPTPQSFASEAKGKGKKKKAASASDQAEASIPLPCEHGKFLCNRFIPDRLLLEELFFASSTSSSYAPAGENNQDTPHIAEQIIAKQQTLSFPNLSSSSPAESKIENSSSSMKLFEDISFGHQIFNTMRSGYKSRKIMVSDSTTAMNRATRATAIGLAMNSSQAIPGSKSYAKQHQSSDPSAAVSASTAMTKMEVSAKSLIASWQYINIGKLTPDLVTCDLDVHVCRLTYARYNQPNLE